ncbi:MAG: hypothetical protein JKY81_04735 [Colwellia sp.]|nr:hypothetical protein [Colwellia sp.]
MNSKICSNKACEHEGLPIPINQFNKDVSRASGVADWCKDCWKIKRLDFLLSRTPEDKARLRKVIERKNKRYLKMNKVCTNPNCLHEGAEQTVDSFHRNAKKKDWRADRCKTCCAATSKEAYALKKSKGLLQVPL